MDIEQLRRYCLTFPGAVEKESSHPSNIQLFRVADKKFAYFKTSEPEKWRFSLRVAPERFLELTDQPGIKPARYMGRFHWVTIVVVQQMEERYLKQLIGWSYDRALASLSKKKQLQLLAGNEEG